MAGMRQAIRSCATLHSGWTADAKEQLELLIALIALLCGVLLAISGFAVRYGRYRRWVGPLERYEQVWLRNSPFVWIPAGCAIAAVGLSGIASLADMALVSTGLLGLACALFALSTALISDPPSLLIPESLAGYARDSRRGASDKTVLRGGTLLFGLAALFFGGVFTLGWLVGAR